MFDYLEKQLKIITAIKTKTFSYQEKSRDHKSKEFPVVLLAYTVIQPLQKHKEKKRIKYLLQEVEKCSQNNSSYIPCNDDQID